jgi:hypothetical protein
MIDRKSGVCRHGLCQRLRELTNLEERGIGVGEDVPLSQRGQLEQGLVVLLQESEVDGLD